MADPDWAKFEIRLRAVNSLVLGHVLMIGAFVANAWLYQLAQHDTAWVGLITAVFGYTMAYLTELCTVPNGRANVIGLLAVAGFATMSWCSFGAYFLLN